MKILRAVRRIVSDTLENRIFMVAELVLALSFIVLSLEVPGSVVFATIACVALVFCRNLAAAGAPILLLSVFVTNLYDSYDIFIKFLPAAIPAALCLIFHFAVYRGKFKIGPSFVGIAATTFAICLGGIGKLRASDYFSSSHPYYFFGLGFGMAAVYLLFRSSTAHSDRDKMRDDFAFVLMLTGLLAALDVAVYYARMLTSGQELVVYMKTHYLSRNNLSTFMMFALPFPLYFSRRKPLYAILSIPMYGAMLLTGSRGGIIFGTVEALLCVIYYVFSEKEHRVRRLAISVATVGLLYLAVGSDVVEIFANRLPDALVFSRGEDRYLMLEALVRRFPNQWLFGEGLVSEVNREIFDAKRGAMCWYHMMIPQIVGSMGVFGALMYLVQGAIRVTLVFRRTNAWKLCAGVSYLGVLLMSQVNPGFFCPVPYAMLGVIMFALCEDDPCGEKICDVPPSVLPNAMPRDII